jgi:2-methylaconitate cis-trans-isomerase PrpF
MRPTLPCQLRLRKTVWRIPSGQPSPRVTAAPDQTAVHASYYRGGTSRAVILQPQDLPASSTKWRGIFRQVLGSIGPGEAYGKQLHRVVKEKASMGKICLVEPYRKMKEDGTTAPHVDYTLVNVDTKSGHVDVEENSGNLLSAVGPYAYNARLLPPDLFAIKDGEVTITVRNTNTMKLVQSTFFVTGGLAAVMGSHVVGGVNGKGSEISLSFQDPTGSTTGKRFPTGNAVDVVEGYRVTCVDGAIPVVFIRADAVGIAGTSLPHELKEQKDTLDLLENIRRAAAVNMGIAHTDKMVPRTIPKIAIVSQSSQHNTVTGATLKPSQMDIVVRFISDTEPHSSIPLTGALTTAVAARMPGTVVEQLLAPEEVLPGTVTIAHPSGRLQVKLDYDTTKKPPVWVASVSSTAQRLFEGKAWVESSKDDNEDLAPETNVVRHGRGLAFVNELRLRASPEKVMEHFYKDGQNIETDLATSLLRNSQLSKSQLQKLQKRKDRPQPSPTQPSPMSDLDLPIPSRTRNAANLLRELSHLRNSLAHFITLYPAPPIVNKLPAPTLSTVSDHLSTITSHINIITASLTHMPRPPRVVTPDRQKGEQWYQWVKMFTQSARIRRPREAEEKRIKREWKGRWERWKDGELNALSKRGRPVVMGHWREKLLHASAKDEGRVEKSAAWKRAHRSRGEGVAAVRSETRSDA